ncbi:hypothetical protein L3X38_037079 [Prunus dulcis]|uniref:PB1-like domain-containing protein n=1 Tax=Prunus dulcis TaxID=3755 RepID=A0AAD4V4S0_PRUDU|nr:hypothetical protein L3X38_037079 [Prunus dulcis]
MGTPNIWMLGLALRWTIFEFSNIRILGIGGHISPDGNPLAKLQLPCPNLLAQVLRGGRQGNHEKCTLELHHGSVLESGEYKNGKVCYMDNVIGDFLSLVDLRKVGKGLGYNVNISNPIPNLEIWYRKGGKHGVGGLELISFDAKLVDMLTQMPCNRIVVLYYTEVGISNKVWTQASFRCRSLDGADNYAEVQHNVQVEDETEVQDKSQVEDETEVQDSVDVQDKDETKVVDREEDDEEFIDSDYECSEEEFGFKTIEVPVHEGAEHTMNSNNERPTFEAPGEVSSDGEHTSDIDTRSEGDGDNEGTSKVRRNKNCLGLSSIGRRWI